MKVGILGDGSMAKAISHLLHKNAVEFEVFSRKNGNIDGISKMQTVFVCVPSCVVSNFIDLLTPVETIISCAKGVVSQENPFISRFFKHGQFCVLSGPNFSSEIMENHKTITTIASRNIEIPNSIEGLLASPTFEIEYTNEVIGVEICGIVKNVIAIMMGYASVKMPSWNEKSLLLAKMFQELSQILQHFDCDVGVLGMSCGVGDIFLTCSSANSRNYKFGVNIANRANVENQTIEGLRSIEFIQSLPLKMPYLKKVHSLLHLVK